MQLTFAPVTSHGNMFEWCSYGPTKITCINEENCVFMIFQKANEICKSSILRCYNCC